MRFFCILALLFTLLFSMACAPIRTIQKDVVDVTSEAAASKYYGMEDYGLKIEIPESLGLIKAQEIDDGEIRYYQFIEKKYGGVFYIALYNNYCDINRVNTKYRWSYLKGCKNQEKQNFVNKYGNKFDFDYYVYSSRAIYFDKGSFISPTLITSTSVKPKEQVECARSKSLAYAYLYHKNYYIIKLSFSDPAKQFDYYNELLAMLVNAVSYPSKDN